MAYQLKSNPLDNNPLFASAVPEEQEAKPQKKPRSASGKQKKQPKRQAAKPQTAKGASAAVKPAEQPAEPVRSKKADSVEREKGDYTRATFIVRRDLLQRLKDVAFTERREIKDVINEILAVSLDEIEEQYQKDGRSLLKRPE